MQKDYKQPLRYTLTSSVGHEQILTDSDCKALLRATYYHSKTCYKKLAPFFQVCENEWKQNCVQEDHS